MIELLNLTDRSRWNTYINTPTNGYYTDNAADVSRTHQISNSDMLEQQLYTYIANNRYQSDYFHHPYYACLSRNRDLDGDGEIDDNEIRWYLAAADQYLRIGIGSDAMSDASRLFMEDKRLIPAQKYPDNFFSDGALYYTSTNYDAEEGAGTNKRVIWAAEVGAFGDYNNADYKMLIRCVRNLPSGNIVQRYPDETVVDNKALGSSSYTFDSDRNLFSFGDNLNPLIFREVQYDDPYGPHFEEPNSTRPSTANRLYHGGFVVAEGDVNLWSTDLVTMVNVWEGRSNPCATYTDNNDQAHQNTWRVPNLREMLIMSTQATNLNFASGNYYYLTSTSFSGRSGTNSAGDRPGFAYDTAGKKITAQPDGNYNIRVRCVRDADPDER